MLDVTFDSNGFTVELSGLIRTLGKTLGQALLGYYGNTEVNGDGIAKSGVYPSTYKDAQWSGVGDDPEKCAKVFLAAASMVFYGLSFIYFQCKNSHGGWSMQVPNVVSNQGFGQFMQCMGYNSSIELRNINGTEVATILDSEGAHNFEELKKAYGNGQYIYSNFVEKLVQQEQSSALNYPLTNCHKMETHYFKSVFKNGAPDDQTIKNITSAFQTFRGSCGNYYPDYKTQITDFIKSCMTPPKPSHPRLPKMKTLPPPPGLSAAPSPPLAWVAELRQPTYSTLAAPRPLSMAFLR